MAKGPSPFQEPEVSFKVVSNGSVIREDVFLSSLCGDSFYLAFQFNMKCEENVVKLENISLSQYISTSNNALMKLFKVLLFVEISCGTKSVRFTCQHRCSLL